jgi:hypothetical protein
MGGGVAERLKAAVLKTASLLKGRDVGSNPTPSAALFPTKGCVILTADVNPLSAEGGCLQGWGGG